MDNLPCIIFAIVILGILLGGKRRQYPEPLPVADQDGMTKCCQCGKRFKLLNKEYWQCLCADCWYPQTPPQERTNNDD